jgi:diguanylate cyclase (GGDEF)-like protein/PAS domain S-box-containing protein/hemerythrin-like metal-binding protein
VSVLATIFPIRDDDGAIIGVSEIDRDLTEQRTIEHSLRESEDKFRYLFENSPVGKSFTEVSGRILVNQAFCDLLGYTAQELQNLNWRDITHPDDIELTQKEVDALLGGAKQSARFTKRFLHRNGTVVWIDLSTALRRDSAGVPLYFLTNLSDITERVEANRRIEYLASHDTLTELPNRALFFDHLAKALSRSIRKAESLTVILLDLDGFKSVNDRYGHESGDIVLKRVGRRLQSCIRSMDTVARLGGDEFGVILDGMGDAADAASIAGKIIASLSAPIALRGAVKIAIGASAGIAIYPQNGSDIDGLMDAADRAMYESKAGGTNSCALSRRQVGDAASDEGWITLGDRYLLGHAAIDEQHGAIANLLNKLHAAAMRAQPATALSVLFDDAIAYVAVHFQDEERLMEQCRFHGREDHVNEHRKLLDEAKYLRERLADGSELLVLHALKDWFLLHVETHDKPLAEYLAANPVGQASVPP